jgi:hypothetical protein
MIWVVRLINLFLLSKWKITREVVSISVYRKAQKVNWIPFDGGHTAGG